MAKPDLIPLVEAAVRLGISRMTLSRLAKEGRFTIYENPRDRRQKLVDEEEVREALQPKPMPKGKEMAAA